MVHVIDGPTQYEFTGFNDIHELAVYLQPISSSEQVGWLRSGAIFEIVTRSKSWVQVRFESQTGWIEESENAEKLYDVKQKSSNSKSWYRVTYAIPFTGLPVYSSPLEVPEKLLGYLHPGVRFYFPLRSSILLNYLIFQECVQVLGYRREWMRIEGFGSSFAWVVASKDGISYLTSEQGWSYSLSSFVFYC